MNQFGSERRMRLALDVDSLDEIAGRIRALIHPETPTTLMDKLKLLPKLAEVGSFFPKMIAAKDAACKQVVHRRVEDGGEGIDLRKLPGADHLAGGRWAVHHAAVCGHARSEVGQAQHGDVSHAGV